MHFKFSIVKLTLILLVLLSAASIVNGQTKQLLTWRETLAYLQTVPATELELQRESIARIRAGVEFWLRLHPGTTLELPSAPEQPWGSDEIRKQVSLLREAVESIEKEYPGRSRCYGI